MVMITMQKNWAVRMLAAVISMTALLATTISIGVSAQSMKSQKSKSIGRLPEEQRILHVLNRLGFGARPGDVERVKALGIDKYIEQQLNADKIDDSASEAKLQNLETLRMPTAELYEKYPQPGQLLKQLERRAALPAELATARDSRVKGGANAVDESSAKTDNAMPAQSGAAANPKPANNNPADQNPTNNPEYRR